MSLDNQQDASKEFQKVSELEQRKIQIRNEIVTKSMANQLENERTTPNSIHSPSPPKGVTKTADMEQAMIRREQRIKYIKDRMNDAQKEMKRGFENSKG